jgi:putative aminopeptidase FrvX
MDWPLSYAHSPGEVIDTKDVDALGKIVEVVARQW